MTLGLTALVWLPFLLWFLAFSPGIMTADSLNVYHQAISGTARWIDWHPPLNTAVMWLSVQLVDGPALVTLGQSFLLAGAMVAMARASMRAGANRRAVVAVTAVLAMTPMVGAFSVSVWKDVPFTACILFVAARVIDLTRGLARGDEETTNSAMKGIVLWGLLASMLRQNGMFFVAILLGTLFLLFPTLRRRALVGVLALVLTLAALKLVIYPAAGIRPQDSRYTLSWVLHDLGSVAVREPTFFDENDRARLERVAPFDRWQAGYRTFTCSSSDWTSLPEYRWQGLAGEERRYLGMWLRLLGEHPLMVLGNRLCLASVAWRPDPVGTQYTVSLDTDPNRWGQRVSPVSDALHDAGVELVELTHEPEVRWLLWRAPLWIYLAYLAFGITAVRRRRWLHLLPLLPLAIQQVTIAVLTLAQDARFMMPGLLLAILLLPLSVARYATPAGRLPALPRPQGSPNPSLPDPAPREEVAVADALPPS